MRPATTRHLPLALVLASAIAVAGAAAAGGPGDTGNCLSATYPFDPARIYTIPRGTLQQGQNYPPVLASVDPTLYDYTIDYAPLQFATDGSVATVTVSKLSDDTGRFVGSQGTRLSTTRYNLYGRFSIKIRAAAPKGLVTTFISMSDRGDEIDWEIVAADPAHPATTNFFYKRVLEYGEHSQNLAIPDGTAQDQWHEYTIDWNADRIEWLIDGQLLRTETKGPNTDDGHKDPSIKGEFYYPSTPSIIQLGLWDAGDDPNKGVADWGGGPVPWGSASNFTSQFQPLVVQCYDDAGKEVPKWPVQGNDGPRTQTAKPTTTAATSSDPPSATSKINIKGKEVTASDTNSQRYIDQPVPTAYSKLYGDGRRNSGAVMLGASLFAWTCTMGLALGISL